MRTAHECLLKADNCERSARTCADPIDRGMMLVTAQHWLNLAKAAELAEMRGSGRRSSPGIFSASYRPAPVALPARQQCSSGPHRTTGERPH
jgi:hypothetical protein